MWVKLGDMYINLSKVNYVEKYNTTHGERKSLIVFNEHEKVLVDAPFNEVIDIISCRVEENR